jgi:Putative auto-transporter adhesin, head GIN domain
VGPQGALDSVTVAVEDRLLKIRVNRSAWGGYPGERAGPVRIEATTRALAAATVTGAGSLAIDKAGGLRLSLSLAGSGRITVGRIAADTLLIALTGSGRISAAGTAKQLSVRVTGSGDLDAAGLAADDAQLYAETSGTVALTARRTAKVQSAGIGEVTIGGTPACTVTGPAAGRVACGR